MAENNKVTDPYAPPPMYHNRSGGMVRVVVLGGLLGAAALGYVWMSSQDTAPLVPEVAQEQQVSDAGYQVSENTIPAAIPETTPAPTEPAATPAPQRRSAPVERATPPEPTPEVVTPPAEPALSPTPLPPIDMPPSGATGNS